MTAASNAEAIQRALGRVEAVLDEVKTSNTRIEAVVTTSTAQIALIEVRLAVIEAAKLADKVETLNNRMNYGLGIIAALAFIWEFFGKSIIGKI